MSNLQDRIPESVLALAKERGFSESTLYEVAYDLFPDKNGEIKHTFTFMRYSPSFDIINISAVYDHPVSKRVEIDG